MIGGNMNKIVSIDEVLFYVKDGDIIMVGGFMVNGLLENLIDYLCSKNIKDLILICNDIGFIDKGVGKMVVNK